MTNAVQAFVDTFNGALGHTNSQNLTFSFAITNEFEAFIPIQIQVSANISFAPEVWYYQSGDGGTTWETQGNLALVFDNRGTGATHTQRRGFKLTTGQYLIRVITGGATASATYTASLQTCWMITSYE